WAADARGRRSRRMAGVAARVPSRAYAEGDVGPVYEPRRDRIGMAVVARRPAAADLLRLAVEVHADLGEAVGSCIAACDGAAHDSLGPIPHAVNDQTCGDYNRNRRSAGHVVRGR